MALGWEYMFVDVVSGGWDSKTKTMAKYTEQLNRLGVDGWEAVSPVRLLKGISFDPQILMKRPLA